MDFGFSEDQQLIRQTVRTYAEAEILPHYQRWDRTGEWLTQDFIDKLVNMGLLRLRLPEKYGGQGYSFVDCGIVCEEIGRCDHQIRYIISNAIHLGEMASSMHPDLQEEWIPRIAKGEMMSLAFTEPGGGADAGNIRTKAVKEGDYYILNGEKTSITFTGVSKVVFVSARTGGPGPRGLSFFLVPTDTPGVKTTNFERMGQRLDRGGSFFFDDVKIPARNMIGKENEGFIWAMTIIGYNRNFVPLACIGAAQKSIDETVEYVKTRQVMGRSVSKWQGVANELATEATKLEAARMLCYRALSLNDRGLRHDAESSMAKWWGVKVANEALYTCMRLHGHYGWAKDLPFEQRLRDCLGMESADGPREVHLGIIARDLLGKEHAPF
ncbi:MAG: acyl-CoA dehydrogenase family protein [Betaproteobacteria bacterium]|jgi:cyclohexanecarboxyl-CoA dehydrogenase|nr:cyclohexanecarboxyl-CoA dehydrogenase [Betaproteobacteria bacterium]NBT69025.1 cyclohexanecarboxyl-CoA dehydrogenase [Betaproteobacteria bacterium]NBY08305.1 cyclohexanecarboxyl-CoA dehydrogenase [Betaproteobacteria bacterium]